MKPVTAFFIRFFDILFSFFAIILFFPLLIPVMIILKLTGEHDIFYKQMRVGRYGKEFTLLKFATMLRDSPNLPGGIFTVDNDPRILPIGNFLRKTKINELPQVFNIIIGQMSFVGYRPLLRYSYDNYTDEVKQKLFCFKPGLSGIGSIVFKNEEEIVKKIENKEYFYKKVIMPYKGKIESWFIEKYSVINYFKIIIITIFLFLIPKLRIIDKVFRDLPEPPKELKVLYKG